MTRYTPSQFDRTTKAWSDTKRRGGEECVRLARSFAVLGDGVYFAYTGKPETAKNVTR